MRRAAALALAAYITATLALIATAAQPQDPCLAAKPVNVAEITGKLVGTLTKTPNDADFYRIVGVKPGQELVLSIKASANTSVSLNAALFREVSPGVFALVDENNIVIGRQPVELGYRWLEAETEKTSLGSFCIKVSQFSEVFQVSTTYEISVSVAEMFDTGGVDAPSYLDGAVSLGVLEPGKKLTITGFLSAAKKGNDYIDIYKLSLTAARGDRLVIKLVGSPEAVLDLALMDQKGEVTLRSNKTTVGEAALSLRLEKAGDYVFYLRISNSGGLGGSAEYTATIELQPAGGQEEGGQQKGGQPGVEPRLSDQTARLIVIGSTAAVAATSILAIIIRTRRRRAGEEYIEYEYY
ncbi:MAG: hypothetical protein NXY59_09360 [Aigarchaeota archaeon]|nr:hypothetical protein [Candidatus Pelearchaeum maunauluense]